MCGVFGVIISSPTKSQAHVSLVRRAFERAESRGKDAAGLFYLDFEKREIVVVKSRVKASDFIKLPKVKLHLKRIDELAQTTGRMVVVGHTRLATNGSHDDLINNQPVLFKDLVGVHNGIIVNVESIWKSLGKNETRSCELDSEAALAVVHDGFTAKNAAKAIKDLNSTIVGASTFAILGGHTEGLLLYSNNGSLYYSAEEGRSIIFGSERLLVEQIVGHGSDQPFAVCQLSIPGAAWVAVKSPNIKCLPVDLDYYPMIPTDGPWRVVQDNIESDIPVKFKNLETSISSAFAIMEREYKGALSRLDAIKRCSKCILPGSFPGIEFDELGVCSICRDYKAPTLRPLNELEQRLKAAAGKSSVLVSLSGGRDSCYSLHYATKELNLKTVAFTYDWGMVTDLARRNQARMCGALGVEHIIVSANIRMKRENIRRNLSAWLKKPHLGMIPLMMAGDKQYFSHAANVRRANKLGELIMGENHFERTLFKTRFAGAKQKNVGSMAYHIDLANKFRLTWFYVKNFLQNPKYLNRSIPDTIGAFVSYYVHPHDYINLFDYVPWDEDTLEMVLSRYEWEMASDTKSSWRIGDGTAPFYNYAYFTIGGFSENDTFRSNQVRAGLLSREKALDLAIAENQPRYDSIRWYCDAVGIDILDAVTKMSRYTLQSEETTAIYPSQPALQA